MELQQKFEEAVAASKLLAQRPDNATLLKLYSLYKQATVGDASEAVAPSNPFDFPGKAKYDAWSSLHGKTSELAMQEYIALVHTLREA